MANGRMTALLSLALAALLAAPAGVAAAPRSANRALERIFEKGPYSDSGAFQITKAFKVAVDAGVEERDALALVEACADGEFSPEQVARILSLAAQIALDDLPADLFVSKVHEGVAKGVDPDLVVRAAERRALDINRASKLLKMLALEGVSTSDREELVPDVAEALAAGVDEGRIRQILTEGAAAGDSVRDIRRKLFP